MDGEQISGRFNAQSVLFLYFGFTIKKRQTLWWRLKNEYLCSDTSIKNGPLPTIGPNKDFLAPVFDVLQSVGRSVTADRKRTISGNEIVLLRYDLV